MARLFVYDGREFPDPDPKLSVEDVRKQLAEFFPELVNADTREEQRGEDTAYTFQKRIGTKGRTGRAPVTTRTDQTEPMSRSAEVVAIIRGVPEKRLHVFALAAELLGADGELDYETAAERGPEINLALAEAKAYARATEQAVEALRRLPPR